VIGERSLARVVDRIVALYDPELIYVFGSYAKGTLSEKSDLDLVVVRPSDLPPRMRGGDVYAVLAEMAFELDLLFMTPEELEAELQVPWSLISTVMPDARVVYERVPAAERA
jgi:predicted nucleotidyltransferase